MLSIAFPLWLIVSAGALPLLCVAFAIAWWVRARRRKRTAAQNAATVASLSAAPLSGFNSRVNQQILEQQIDAVFDAMVTLIDTERMKLKALVNHTLGLEMAAPTPVTRQTASDRGAPTITGPDHAGRDDDADEADLPVREQVALLAEEGTAPEEIARRLGLSAVEVALAIKLHAPQSRPQGRRIEAVA